MIGGVETIAKQQIAQAMVIAVAGPEEEGGDPPQLTGFRIDMVGIEHITEGVDEQIERPLRLSPSNADE